MILLAYHLIAGWFLHLLAVVPQLKPDLGTIALSLTASVIAIALLHGFIKKAFNPSWPWNRTLLSAGIFLTLTAAAIVMTGIVHELAWLARSRVVVSNMGQAANRTEAINNGKQVYLAMLEMSDEGIHPKSIEEIIEFLGSQSHLGKLFTYQPSDFSRVREPFMLLHPGEDISALPPSTPIIAALGLDGGRCIIVRADGSAEAPYYEDLETLLQQGP